MEEKNAFKRSVSLKLIDSAGKLVTSVSDAVVQTDGLNKPFRVNFAYPGRIKENHRYSLVLAVSGNDKPCRFRPWQS